MEIDRGNTKEWYTMNKQEVILFSFTFLIALIFVGFLASAGEYLSIVLKFISWYVIIMFIVGDIFELMGE